MLASNFGVNQGIVPGAVVPGVGVVGAPGLQASGVYGGAPVATTNQFYTQGYNQGLFGCNNCPWWLWLIIGFIVIGSLIGVLAALFGGDDRKERRRGRRGSRRVVQDQEQVEKPHYHMRYSS